MSADAVVEATAAGLLEESAEELYEDAPCGYLSMLPDGTIARVNRTFCAWTGYTAEQLVGRRRWVELLTAGARIFHETHYAPLLRMQGAVREIAVDVVCADGRQLPVLVNSMLKTDADGQPLVTRTTVFNATDRKEYELELLRQKRRAAFLYEASTVIAAAADFVETVDRLAEVAVPELGDICIIDIVDDESGELRRMAARHADPARQSLVDRLRTDYHPRAEPHPSVEALKDRQSRWSAELADDDLRAMTYNQVHFDLVRELGVTGYMVVPLVTEDRVLGSITILSAGSERRFGPGDLALAEELAGQVATVVAKTRRYELEHETSHTLQASLLPARLPSVPGLAIAVRYLPGTRDVEVGGDFYDVLSLPNGVVAVTVGDVAGHDITAAATMGQLRSAFRALIGEVDGPAALLRKVQDNWDLLDLDRMATAAWASLDPRTGALAIASAGHPPPLLIADGRGVFVPVEPCAPLGAPVTEVVDWKTTMPRGATLLLFSDGLVEDRLQDIEVGLDRVLAAALAAGTTDPERMCDAILAEVAGEERSDDVALLAITRL